MRFDTTVTIKLKDAFAARSEPEAVRILATFYWAVLIMFLVAVALVSIVVGFEELMTPLTQAPVSSVAGTRKSLSRDDIVNVLHGFEARGKSYEVRKSAPLSVHDPS